MALFCEIPAHRRQSSHPKPSCPLPNLTSAGIRECTGERRLGTERTTSGLSSVSGLAAADRSRQAGHTRLDFKLRNTSDTFSRHAARTSLRCPHAFPVTCSFTVLRVENEGSDELDLASSYGGAPSTDFSYSTSTALHSLSHPATTANRTTSPCRSQSS